MTKTASKRRKVVMPGSIRKKFSAALCMLLVSSIMLITSTYAWFTLSTAPEVTGITTNVGANGNLEIALLNATSYASTDKDLGIASNVGDSMTVQPATEANETWGNLVDLGDSVYGLNSIVLTPAALNINSDGTLNPTILLAPSYGSDGRVIDVSTNTFTGGYIGSNFVYNDAYAGVRAIGTTTAVSQRVAAYRNAKAALTTNTNAAKSKAAASLVDNGQDLANIMVNHVADATSKVTAAQKASLDAMVTALKAANVKAGDAIKRAVLANSLSATNANEMTDDDVTALVNAIDAANVADLSTVSNVVMPTEAAGIITKWQAINTNLNAAGNSLTSAQPDGDNNYAYDDIYTGLSKLVDREHVTIAGITNPGREDLDAIVSYYTTYQRIDITMGSGSGVYADIAELVGNYTASGLTVSVTYSGMTVNNMPVSMNTNVTPSAIVPAMTIGGAPASGNVTNAILSDTYGYAIDFGFRTNAAGSDLLLQTAAAQRVYSDSDSAVTQGAGSYMEFHSANTTTFTVDEVRALMSAIRVAFVTPVDTGYQVLGLGALDITRSVDGSTGIATYTGGEAVGTDGLKASLYLYDYRVDTANENAITLGAKKDDQTALTALEQNVAKKVTVIVYLDGDLVDNTMVANAMTSMSGKMNLQFSSSATLAPMENSALRNAEAGTVTYTHRAVAGSTYTYGGQTAIVNTGYTIYSGSNGKVYFSTDGNTYTELTISNYSTALTVSGT